MQYAAKSSWPPVFFNHIEAVSPGVAAMNDDGQPGLLSESHLVAEDAVLRVARRMIVEIIEANLAPRDDSRMLRQPGQFFQMLLRDFFRFVGMNAHGRVNPIVLLSKG